MIKGEERGIMGGGKRKQERKENPTNHITHSRGVLRFEINNQRISHINRNPL